MTIAIFVCSVLAAFLAGFLFGTVNKAHYGAQQFAAGARHIAFLARQRKRAKSQPVNHDVGC